jgi:hypothetical protein
LVLCKPSSALPRAPLSPTADLEMEVKRAEFDDCKELSELITKTGGVSIYKATFGTYNLSNMIENSYLSLLTACPTGSEQKETVCFMSVNDGLSLIASDPDAYTKVITGLSQYIPATVRSRRHCCCDASSLFRSFISIHRRTTLCF